METVYHVLSFYQNSSCRPHFYFRYASPWRRLRTRGVLTASEPVAYRLVYFFCFIVNSQVDVDVMNDVSAQNQIQAWICTFVSQENQQKLLQPELYFWLQYAPNRLSAGALPHTALGSLLTALPTPFSWVLRGPSPKGMEGERGRRGGECTQCTLQKHDWLKCLSIVHFRFLEHQNFRRPLSIYKKASASGRSNVKQT